MNKYSLANKTNQKAT